MEKYSCLNLVIHKGSTKRNQLVAEVLKGINNVFMNYFLPIYVFWQYFQLDVIHPYR